MDEQLTKTWKQYQNGKTYLNSKNYFDKLEKNYNFYNEEQWKGMEAGDMAMPIDNFITPICNYKIGVVSQYNNTIVYSADNLSVLEQSKELGMEFKDIAKRKIELLNKLANQFFEKNNMETEAREYIERACVDGMVCMYINNENDEEKAEMVYAENIYLNDENEYDIQNQDYILIAFRRPVVQIREEARNNGISESNIELITADNDTTDIIGNKEEVETEEGKCLCILKLYKKNSTVHMVKSTKTVEYVKETDLKLTLYPVAKMVWLKQKNNTRGKGEPEGKIANQIEDNKTLARRGLAIMMTAYSKTVYNKNLISDPSKLNKVGVAIGIEGSIGTDVRQAIDYLRPAQISPDAKIYNDELSQKTKENANAGDTALGNVDPTKASGRAIIAVKDSSAVPINIHVSRNKRFYEDLARILFDIWQNTAVNGKKVVVEKVLEDGGKKMEIEEVSYDFMQKLKLSIKVDITPTDPYSRYAQEQAWESLFINGKITFEEWVNGLPDNSISNKSKLEEIVKKRQEKEQEMMSIEQEIQDKQEQVKGIVQEQQIGEMNEIEQDVMGKEEQVQELIRELGGNQNDLQTM